MPRVATGRGLANPFEPAAALHESAEFLRELRDRFGNLGLAAAAYNAGPGRVQKWLARKSALPRETRNYVHIITGYRPEKWVNEPPVAETAEFTSEQCNAIAKLAVSRQKLATLERFADIVSQRLNQKVRFEASVTTTPRGTGRKGILAKRGAPVADTRIEQVTRVVAQSGKRARVEKIIRIVAQRNAAPVVKTAHAAKATQIAEKPAAKGKGAVRPLQLAGLAKGKATAPAVKKGVAVAAPKKVAATAAAAPKSGKGAAKVRVASNSGRG
jgi:hypothetical protein